MKKVAWMVPMFEDLKYFAQLNGMERTAHALEETIAAVDLDLKSQTDAELEINQEPGIKKIVTPKSIPMPLALHPFYRN